jgi:hypothetical protein
MRYNIKEILKDPKKRKRLLKGACNFLIAIGRYT